MASEMTTMMTSDLTPEQELREAAERIRAAHGPEHIRHAFWSAVANWLENEAGKLEQGMVYDQRETEAALDAARGYLGASNA